AYQLKIDLLTKFNRANEVLPWMEKSSSADPLNVNLKMMLAQQYAAHKKTALAESTYLALADESPNEDIYRGLFGLPRPNAGRYILGQFDRAIQVATKKPPEAGNLRAGEQARAMLAVLRDDAAIA